MMIELYNGISATSVLYSRINLDQSEYFRNQTCWQG